MRRITLLALVLTTLVGACAPSVVYDPSLQLPHRPLEQGDVQAALGAAYLLETRPDVVERNGDAGGTILLRGAFSPRLTFGLRHWMSFSSLEDSGTYRSGISGELQLKIGDQSGQTRYSVLSRSAMLIADGSIEGGGFGLQGVATRALSQSFGLYAGFGPVFGYRDITEDQWGLGVIGNLGASFAASDAFSIGAEISGVGAYDAYREKMGGGVSPSLFLSFVF